MAPAHDRDTQVFSNLSQQRPALLSATSPSGVPSQPEWMLPLPSSSQEALALPCWSLWFCSIWALSAVPAVHHPDTHHPTPPTSLPPPWGTSGACILLQPDTRHYHQHAVYRVLESVPACQKRHLLSSCKGKGRSPVGYTCLEWSLFPMSLSPLMMALITVIPITVVTFTFITKHFSVPETPPHAVPYLLLRSQ